MTTSSKSPARGDEAERRYEAVCRNCHAGALRRLIPAKHPASTVCLGCHMPKRRTDDVVHAVMTDHFIQRRKPARDLLAPLQERRDASYIGEVVPYHPPKPDAETELYQAVAQVRHGANLKRGIPRLAGAIGKNQPKEGEFYFELGEAYWKNDQKDEAIAAYETALERSPGFLPAIRGLGTALAKTGQPDRAAEILRRMPEDPTTLNDLALVYIAQAKASGAVPLLRKALSVDPDLADALNNLGGALLSLGDQKGAEEAYRNAIRVQPDLAGAHKNLAGLLASRDSFAESEYHYREAIRSDPAFFAAYYDFGVALAERERYREAAEQFEAAVRLNPTGALAHSSLADMYALLGNKAKAVQHYDRALALKPDLEAAREGLRALR